MRIRSRTERRRIGSERGPPVKIGRSVFGLHENPNNVRVMSRDRGVGPYLRTESQRVTAVHAQFLLNQKADWNHEKKFPDGTRKTPPPEKIRNFRHPEKLRNVLAVKVA